MGTSVVAASVVGASVVGASVVRVSVVRALVVRASVVRASVVGTSVVGDSVVAASVVTIFTVETSVTVIVSQLVPVNSGKRRTFVLETKINQYTRAEELQTVNTERQ